MRLLRLPVPVPEPERKRRNGIRESVAPNPMRNGRPESGLRRPSDRLRYADERSRYGGEGRFGTRSASRSVGRRFCAESFSVMPSGSNDSARLSACSVRRPSPSEKRPERRRRTSAPEGALHGGSRGHVAECDRRMNATCVVVIFLSSGAAATDFFVSLLPAASVGGVVR